MEDFIISSAGFFLYEGETEKWFTFGMSRDFDTVMFPTVSSKKGRVDVYQAMENFFQKFGWFQPNSFTEVYKKLKKLEKGKGETLTLCYLVNDMKTGFSQTLPKLPLSGIEVIEMEHGFSQFFFWEINEFERHLDENERPKFKALINKMAKDQKFLHDNVRLIINVNNPSYVVEK